MIIGYARAPSPGKNLDMQIKHLQAEGCDRVIHDTSRGLMLGRGLQEAISLCGRGDTLVVWSVEVMSPVFNHVAKIIDDAANAGVTVRSLLECANSDSAAGTMLFHVRAAFTEYAKQFMEKRSNPKVKPGPKGPYVPRRPGSGRPRSISQERIDEAQAMIDAGKPVRWVALLTGIGVATLYRRTKIDLEKINAANKSISHNVGISDA
jgi:DNA invertase Pin-like site-specific DNA recombinase